MLAPFILSSSNNFLTEADELPECSANKDDGTTTNEEITSYAPPTVSIAANPETIQSRGSSTLMWSSTDADSCDIQPDVGQVEPNGSTTVSPTETTTYTITATGPGGTAQDSVTVTVE
jgi:hypothetical protein